VGSNAAGSSLALTEPGLLQQILGNGPNQYWVPVLKHILKKREIGATFRREVSAIGTEVFLKRRCQ
jgi:hypothetical protein